MKKDKRKLAYLALVVGVVSGSFSSPLLRYIIKDGVSEETATLYRVAFAAIAIFPYHLISTKKRKELSRCIKQRDIMLCLFGLGLLKAGTLVTQALSLESLESFAFNTVYYLNPLIVMVLSFFFLHEKTPTAAIFAAVVSIGGVVLATLGEMNMTGVMFAGMSAAFYAGYIVLGRRLRSRVSASVSVFVPMCISAVAMYVFCIVRGAGLFGFESMTWLLLVALGLVCTLLSQSMPIWAVGHLNSTTCSLFSLFSLVLAGGIAYFMLGEVPSWRMVAGATLLCGGLAAYLIIVNKHRK